MSGEKQIKSGNMKRRHGMIFHPTMGYPIPPPIPLTVSRRNARERSRVKTVNDSYESLKAHVPTAANNKRMAKVDIIKHTIEYIQKLQQLVSSIEEPEYESKQQYFDVEKVTKKLDFLPNSDSTSSHTSFPSSRLSCESSSYSPGCDSGYGSPGGQYFQFPHKEKTAQYLDWGSNPAHNTDTWWGGEPEPQMVTDHALLDAIADWQDS